MPACYRVAMFLRWLFPVLLLFAALAGEAEAADLPPVDPPGVWHKVTQDDATTDSKCIGKPVTPVCAVETIIACFVRKDRRLCRIGEGQEPQPDLTPGNPGEGVWERYRITAVRRATPKRPPAIAGITVQKGDMTVDVHKLWCQFSQCEPTDGPPTTYLLRPMDGRWAAVSWETPRW